MKRDCDFFFIFLIFSFRFFCDKISLTTFFNKIFGVGDFPRITQITFEANKFPKIADSTGVRVEN